MLRWLVVQWYNQEKSNSIYYYTSDMHYLALKRFIRGDGMILGDGDCDATGSPIDPEGIIRSSGIRAKTI